MIVWVWEYQRFATDLLMNIAIVETLRFHLFRNITVDGANLHVVWNTCLKIYNLAMMPLYSYLYRVFCI